MNIVRLKNIDYIRNDRKILNNINWNILQGRHWALLGANGSGKTSLLQIITGYVWASNGQVEVLNQRFGQCNIRELRKSIGWVSSALEHRLPIDDTVLNIVESGLDASIGLYREFDAKENQQALDALETMNIVNLADALYGRLSQGEQQRVLIARALVLRPRLLILDEPCIGLDPAARQHLLENIGQLTHESNGPTLLFVTHHIEEIHPWINHTLILKEGRILAQDSTAAVLTGPILSEAFDRPCRIEQDHGGYRLLMSSTEPA